jgi:hypothetical protein
VAEPSRRLRATGSHRERNEGAGRRRPRNARVAQPGWRRPSRPLAARRARQGGVRVRDEDTRAWETEVGRGLGPGAFGENLTTEGIDVSGALVGERWRIGTTLEVVQPRLPCFKLGLRMDDPSFVKRFAQASRPGAYLRIVEEGDLGAGDAVASIPAHCPITASRCASCSTQSRSTTASSPKRWRLRSSSRRCASGWRRCCPDRAHKDRHTAHHWSPDPNPVVADRCCDGARCVSRPRTVEPKHGQVRLRTSLVAGSSSASGASSQAAVALVTSCGRRRPAATRSRMAGIAGRAIARPRCRCTPRV